MARFRNDHGEDRVVPTLGYVLVPAGDSVTVPDDQAEHWSAGGWTRLEDTLPPPPPPRPAPVAGPVAVPAESEAQQ
ncbi:hypothetical protein P3T36_006899 [Kitasatospora sp. MAP12-15]|uniref:hypothetical protein n=1 Tax=unclassified Kitasatospora TaxID=2633591 RepID=UPI002474E5C7|nr:hypothetical protein [Kitasatospora sp. MAP12-44]MDH6111918.1 hypothetical protein [Kitasatospora sp. MAP12-44]